MKLGFAMPHMVRLKAMTQPWEAAVTGADQTRLAKWAEKLGYVMLAVPEHHIIPREHVELSGPHYLNAYTAMAHFAGATETIRVNSCVGLLPTLNPIITAKALSTMDWLSSGRVTATFGVGWLKEEFDLLGVPFAQRGAMAEEYTQAIIELWTKENPEFEGKYVSFKDVAFEPKCVQKPHLPIWFGGDADAVLARTQSAGDFAGPGSVSGEHRGVEPVDGVVGDVDRMFVSPVPAWPKEVPTVAAPPDRPSGLRRRRRRSQPTRPLPEM